MIAGPQGPGAATPTNGTEEALIAALRRLARVEPTLGASRSEGWAERVSAMATFRKAVETWVRAERRAEVPVERVVVRLKQIVNETLRGARHAIDVTPIRDKAIGWCAVAYFAGDAP